MLLSEKGRHLSSQIHLHSTDSIAKFNVKIRISTRKISLIFEPATGVAKQNSHHVDTNLKSSRFILLSLIVNKMLY